MSTFGIPNVAPALETQLISQMAQVESLLRSHTRSEYPFVDETAHHLVAAGGKRLRPLLTLLTAQYGDPNADGVIAAAVAPTTSFTPKAVDSVSRASAKSRSEFASSVPVAYKASTFVLNTFI